MRYFTGMFYKIIAMGQFFKLLLPPPFFSYRNFFSFQSVLRKVTPEDAPKISDQIMAALIQMFSSNSGRSGGIQEDALLAVSTLIEVLGEKFLQYMDSFKPFLYVGLKNHAEYQVRKSLIVFSEVDFALKII